MASPLLKSGNRDHNRARVRAGEVVSGTVLDCNGNALNGALVTIFKVEGTSETPVDRVTTELLGQFRFDVKSGTYNVLVVCPGGSAATGNFEAPMKGLPLKLTCCPQSSSKRPSPNNNANVKTANGLTVVTFNAAPAKVAVKFPDDIAAGDTISGTVVAEPNGQSDDERQRNKAELSGYVIQLGEPGKGTGAEFSTSVSLKPSDQVQATGNIIRVPFKVSVRQPTNNRPTIFTAQLMSANEVPPAGDNKPQGSATATVVLNVTRSGATISAASARFDFSTTGITSNGFLFPNLIQHGIEIVGPFDGNSSNTALDIVPDSENVSGGSGLYKDKPLAESPRKAVFENSTNVTGPIQLKLKEGSQEATGASRIVGVNLTAPKTNLLKGERTTLKTEVTGLRGIKKPVPLTLEAQGVITMEGGMFQHLFIQPSQVGTDGTYITTREITGVQAGGWSATSTVVTQPFNIILRDPDPPQTMLFNSFTGDYIFCSPQGKFSGTAQVRQEGCTAQLNSNQKDHEVKGPVKICVPVDNSRYSIFFSAATTVDFKVIVTDTRIPRIRLYRNPLGKPAPPIQDTSAFATCP